MRLGGGADPLGQHQPAVDVEAQQWLQRQRGAQPGRAPADPAAAPQVVQPVHDDERMAARHGRTGRGLDGIQIGTGGGRPRAAAKATNPTPIAADLELTTRTAGPNSRAAGTAEL